MAEHYITIIEVKKITTADSKLSSESKRSAATVARIVLSGKTLESVKEKAEAHLQLIEDGGDINA